MPWQEVMDTLSAAQQLWPAAQWALSAGHVALAMALATRGRARGGDVSSLRVACRVAFDAASLDAAAAWADELETSSPPPGPGEMRLIEAIRERCRVVDRLARPGPTEPAFAAVPRRVVSLLAYSLPFASNGYALRSHGLLRAVKALGWDVQPCTRPGFPFDSTDVAVDAEVSPDQTLDGLIYHRLLKSRQRSLGRFPYLLRAADEISEWIGLQRPSVVHAASNYATALPGLIASREAGLPFVYEVRGFWDVTRASSDPGFARSSEGLYLRFFERLVLSNADAIVTLTDAMANELVRRGAEQDKIFVARNAVDLPAMGSGAAPLALRAELGLRSDIPVIGYVGSFVDYEGLDDLVAACAMLRDRGILFQLLLVGDGLTWGATRDLVRDVGLEALTKMPGRVGHQLVGQYYALIDICPFPRKPWPVAELVSPLKPLEAMSHQRAVVVSDVAAMSDMVEDGVTGRRFRKGDVTALANVLASLLASDADRAELGVRARRWVGDCRSWHQSAVVVQRAYKAAITRRAAGPSNRTPHG